VASILLAMAALAVVAGMKPSPATPVLLHGAGPAAPLAAVADGLGLTGWSRHTAEALSIAVMALFGAAFVFGLREAWSGRLSPRKVLWIALALQVAAVVLPLLLSRDVYSYSMYGRIDAVYHQNPYVATPRHFQSDPLYPFVGSVWRDTPAVYGPAFTLFSGLLARVISSPLGLMWAFKITAGLAAIGTLLLVAWIARRVAPGRAAFAVVLFGWNPAIVAYAVGGGHNDLLVAVCIAGALAVLVRGGVFERLRGRGEAPAGWPRHELLAIALLMLGTLVKASAGPALALAVVASVAARPRGSRWRLVAMEGAVILGLAVAFGAPYWQTTNPTLGLSELATHRGWVTATRLLLATLGGVGENLFGAGGRTAVEAVIRVSMTATAVAALVLVAVAAVRRTRSAAPGWTAPAEGAAWGWAMLVFILAAPVLLPWYVAWVLPVAWFLPRGGRVVVVGLSCLLAVTHAIAEPALGSDEYKFVLLVGHDVVGPALLVALVWSVVQAVRMARGRLTLEDNLLVAATPPGEREPAKAGHD
jgi:alpha-1,6-mannosyltransferase